MTIGFLARMDNSGLGTMSWEMCRHLKFDEVMLVSRKYNNFPKRFDGQNIVKKLNTDIIVTIETWYDWNYLAGKKWVLIPMYECTMPLAYKPHRTIAVSLLDKKWYPDSVYLPFPVARDRLPFKLRKRANVFVHNAGHGGLTGRNGTQELLEAMRYVKSDIKLIINSQNPIICSDKRVEVRVKDYENYWEIWNEGDVFIFPEKFNGLSLPIQEAISVGMPIMCTDRFPFNSYLPKELMIKSEGVNILGKRQGFMKKIPSAKINPKDIAQKIDEWAGRDITKYSLMMDKLAQQLSWESLKEQWQKAITIV